jgi:glutamate/tyrosine decarboxylase-like PLP-dependent enzyme
MSLVTASYRKDVRHVHATVSPAMESRAATWLLPLRPGRAAAGKMMVPTIDQRYVHQVRSQVLGRTKPAKTVTDYHYYSRCAHKSPRLVLLP